MRISLKCGVAGALAFVMALAGCRPPSQSGPRTAPPSPKTAAVPSPVQFVDIAAESGLDFRQTNGASKEKLFPESMCSGGMLWDFNDDGWLDVFLVQGAPRWERGRQGPTPTCALYRGGADGRFIDVTEQAGVGVSGWGMGTAAGDIDNDGHTDLVITSYDRLWLFRNGGDGSFADITESAGLTARGFFSSASFADYDADGLLDLYVCRYVEYDIEHDHPCTNPHGARTYCTPEFYQGAPGVLYHNLGNRRFADVTTAAGVDTAAGRQLGCAWADYDDDGDQDLYLACDTTENLLFNNQGDGRFTEVALTSGVSAGRRGEHQGGMGVDWADVNGDGALDLFVANYAGESNALYEWIGGGVFEWASSRTHLHAVSLQRVGFGAAFLDADNDGREDLIIANGHVLDDVEQYEANQTYAQPDLFFWNRGDRFEDVSQSAGDYFSQAYVGRGLATGDIDNDGDVDVLIVNVNRQPSLLQNQGVPGSHWLQLRLLDHGRDAIGARATLKVGDRVLLDEVRSGASYCSQSDLRLHFGLGESAVVDELVVRWVDGKLTRWTDAGADALLTIDHDRGLLAAGDSVSQ